LRNIFKFKDNFTVHARDIFDDLVRSNVKSVTDFEWLKQARFYFSFEEDKTLVSLLAIILHVS